MYIIKAVQEGALVAMANYLALGDMSITSNNLELIVAYLNHHFGNYDSGRQ